MQLMVQIYKNNIEGNMNIATITKLEMYVV